jgi:hypothetical protein
MCWIRFEDVDTPPTNPPESPPTLILENYPAPKAGRELESNGMLGADQDQNDISVEEETTGFVWWWPIL